jgi:hypothetical protein
MSQEEVTLLWPDRKPDFDRLLRVFHRQEPPDCVPFIELFADPEVVAAVLGEKPIYALQNDWHQREAALGVPPGL